jgi:tetratricopeptide (TPR) repeat protein
MRFARILLAAFAIGWCGGAAAQSSDAGAAADIQSYVDYGDSLRVQGRFAEAAEVYSRAIEKAGVPDVDDWELFYSRAICYEQNGQWDKAEPDFRMALKLQPNQPLVLNYLGYMLIETGQNLTEGMEMVRKAVEISPNDGYAVDSLGWGYFPSAISRGQSPSSNAPSRCSRTTGPSGIISATPTGRRGAAMRRSCSGGGRETSAPRDRRSR